MTQCTVLNCFDGGADGLYGGNNEDILIGGTTSFDNDNAALATLTYRGADAYSGPETITLTVDDLGHNGAGGPLNFLFDTLSALSLMIAFYYALTGFACAIRAAT